MTRKVGLAGYGYWGRNLARCLNELGVLVSISEKDYSRAEQAAMAFKEVSVWVEDQDTFLSEVDTVVVATPPETHYDIAREALNHGKDVFIEKPMTVNSPDADTLVSLARNKGCNLMVGHIYLHNEGIKAMTIPVGRAELYVQLLNPSGAPSDATRDVVWAGLPHAVSLALHFFPDWPEKVVTSLNGSRIRVRLQYWNGSEAYLDVGDNTGRKLRRVELRDGRTPPQTFDVASPNVLSGKQVTEDDPEPLKTECETFLNYEGVDLMGPKVVKLIEEILHGCDP